MNHLGRALLEYNDPPVKMLFVYNCNPLATMPDQNRVLEGLKRDDLFTVVFEQVFTDTARYADVVLPATTFLEHYDIAKGYGPITPAARAAGDRAVRRGAPQRRGVLGAGRAPRRRRRRKTRPTRCCGSPAGCRRASAPKLLERGVADAAARRRADAVRRRVPADRRTARSICFPRRIARRRARRPVRLPARSGDRAASRSR